MMESSHCPAMVSCHDQQKFLIMVFFPISNGVPNFSQLTVCFLDSSIHFGTISIAMPHVIGVLQVNPSQIRSICADIFRGQIIDVSPTTYTIQVVGTSDKLEAFIEAMCNTQILEVVRTGVSGISRGEKALSL